MAIRVTPDGKVITRGGLPSCTCCECPECTTLSLFYFDYETSESDTVELIGSVSSGVFTNGNLSVTWNGSLWVVTDVSQPGDQFNGGSNTNRCDPSGSWGYVVPGGVTADQWYGAVLSMSGCTCAPEQTSICLRHYHWEPGGEVMYDFVLTGSLNAGSFTDGVNTISWDGEKWNMVSGIMDIDLQLGNEDRCNLIGALFAVSDTGGPPPTTNEVVGWGDCVTCGTEQTELCVYLLTYDGVNSFESYVTLTGSLTAGYFTDGTITVFWDGYKWVGTNSASATTNSTIATDRCDPTGFAFSDNSASPAPEPWIVNVEGFGTCACPCPPTSTTATIVKKVSGVTVDTATMDGSACLGEYTGISGGTTYNTAWNAGTGEWELSDSSEAFAPCATTPSTDSCSPAAEYDNCGGSITYIITCP